MLGALIPVSEALQTTGGTELIAGWLTSVAAVLPVWGALALILVSAMAVTPFLNNAATVLVMAPIAAMFASGLHLRPDAFLMAVAVGAGCDRSEEQTSELQSLMRISYAVFCLEKKRETHYQLEYLEETH